METKGFNEIVGARIAGVVLKDNPESPRQQVFLCFTSGIYLEIYGGECEPIKGAAGTEYGSIDRLRSLGQDGAEVRVIQDTETQGTRDESEQARTESPAYPPFRHPEVLALVLKRVGRAPDLSPVLQAFCVYCLTFIVPWFGLLIANAAFPRDVRIDEGTVYALAGLGLISAGIAYFWNQRRNAKWIEEYVRAESELGITDG